MDLLVNLTKLMSVFPEMHSRSVIDSFKIRNFLVNLRVFKFSDDT